MSAPTVFWFETLTEEEVEARYAKQRAELLATCQHPSRTRPQLRDDGSWLSCCWRCGTFVPEDGPR